MIKYIGAFTLFATLLNIFLHAKYINIEGVIHIESYCFYGLKIEPGTLYFT